MAPPPILTEGWLLLVGSGLTGLVIGSFLNVVIYRLPRMLEAQWRRDCAEVTGGEPIAAVSTYNLAVPGSTCPGCGRAIRPWENIPILSYIALRARCCGCGMRISPRYPLVEFLAGLLAVFFAWRFGLTPALAGALLLGWTLLAATCIDLDHLLLPDTLTLPLLWLGLVFNLAGTYVPLRDAVIGALAGYLSLWAVFHLFRLATGKEGLGRGDFKLLAALGAWMGWRMLPLIVLAAAAIGVILGGGWLLYHRHGRERPIPFGPFLAAAGILALVAGPLIEQTYLGWIRVG